MYLRFTACPANISVSNFRGSASCNIPSSCTAVQCCVEVGLVGRTFDIGLDIDYCRQMISFNIERLTKSVSLNQYNFGKIRYTLF